ncbi:uncharacterized protein LOC122370537 isoform X3 [Amphibalanus amphitrite]|uniref:uncharacterized protein LOC122364451 isoform X2 n=1 Tax=Amphibalanus amphitrite TaxID=1232801 RepID=UPI001C913B72|nr:uncharacterized protein LOC122364451 isoform X2 [Amphibalanus amphitrite]XP_043202139.1 uncharacterized protein LOC122370537 isoform X3 [Amphibalanus amphitrite]
MGLLTAFSHSSQYPAFLCSLIWKVDTLLSGKWTPHHNRGAPSASAMCSEDDPGGGEPVGPVVRPTAEELLRPPERDLLCPEPGCGRRMPQPSALRFHLLRRHGKRAIRGSSTALPPTAVFICPEPDCLSSGVSKKAQFGSLKALKQHYLKVHAPRTLLCPKCQTASFASEALMRAHWRLCAAEFKCSCGAQYSNVRSLRSHAAKYGHSTTLKDRTQLLGTEGLRRLAPKPSPDALHLLASIALAALPARVARQVNTCDAATQTAARRAPRGGRSSGTQTRLTSGTAGQTAPPACRTAGSQCVAVAAASAASQAGPPLVWGLLWPAPAAAASLTNCQTQTEDRPRPVKMEMAQQTKAVPLEQLLWEAGTGTSGPTNCQTQTEYRSKQRYKTVKIEVAQQTKAVPLEQLLWEAETDSSGLTSCQTQTEYRSKPVKIETAQQTQSVPLEDLLWESQVATEGLTNCQTQTEGGWKPVKMEMAQQTKAVPLEELLWEAQQADRHSLPPHKPLSTQRGRQQAELRPSEPLLAPTRVPPAAGSQTETDMLSAETQTQDPFDVIKHMLRSEEEQLLFPELSELSGTDIQTQTPWLTDDSQTQTPWWSDDRTDVLTSHTQTAPVTHMETQTCLLCLGPCDCWGPEAGAL